MDAGDPSGIVTTIVLAAGAGLSGAVTVLFKIVMKQSDEQIKTSERIGRLEGKQEGITSLSKKVLETVHNALTGEDKNKKDKDSD